MRCAAIGEILFDCFPDRAVLGGAPGNVCCMLRQFGAESAMVSAVGRDPLGDRALDELARHGVDTRWIIRSDRPTGAVNVTLDGAGKASYAFAPDSAYDHLEWSGELGIFAGTLDAVYARWFGENPLDLTSMQLPGVEVGERAASDEGQDGGQEDAAAE